MKRPKIPAKSTRRRDEMEIDAGKLERTKTMIAAATKLFWLRRGIMDEGRDAFYMELYGRR